MADVKLTHNARFFKAAEVKKGYQMQRIALMQEGVNDINQGTLTYDKAKILLARHEQLSFKMEEWNREVECTPYRIKG